MLDDKNDTIEDLKTQVDYLKQANDNLTEDCNKWAKKIGYEN